MTRWDRLEGRGRSTDLRAGIEARIADPMWLLARQWQVGEFVGDDAGSPLAITVEYENQPVTGVLTDLDVGPSRIDPSTPLEYQVEAAPPPLQEGARLATSARMTHRLRRMLQRSGFGALATQLQSVFGGLGTDGDVVALGARSDAVVRMLRQRSFDSYALAVLPRPLIVRGVEAAQVDDVDGAVEVITAWQDLVQSWLSVGDRGAWKSDRLEHSFMVSADTPTGPLVLAAKEHNGGHLDWYSFDVVGTSHDPLVDEGGLRSFTTMPTPVTYAGQPAARWWEFEDREVQFGDIAAGPNDLARMIVADFATVYSDDWYVVPLVVPSGSVTRVRQVRLVDTFGVEEQVHAAALTDSRPAFGRVWSMFEMFGDTSLQHGVSPLLFVPPAVVGTLHGPVLERVEFVRDEGANLAWAVEAKVEGPLGRAVNRRESWKASQPPDDDDQGRTTPTPTSDHEYRQAYWRYRLESPTPPFWVPLVPERIDADAPDIVFRRGRMQSWEYLDQRQVGARSEVLEPNRPLTIREEEIPRGGVTVDRRWQLARWHDGSLVTWQQRQKRQGRGERTSGLEYDRITTVVPEP
jgi:hypothetical protein